MYYPYLRGRRAELLAIRELSESKKLEKVIPIFEPIDFSGSLISTMNVIKRNNDKVIFIINPQIGEYIQQAKEKKKKYDEFEDVIYKSHNIIKGVIVEGNAKRIVDKLIKSGIDKDEIVLICLSPDYIDEYKSLVASYKLLSVIPYDISFSSFYKGNIMINDRFKAQSRNKDYKKKVDEFFSNDIKDYKANGFIGFSDYSIIGNNYSKGFRPYAVAFHIVYNDDSELRIHHFVSDQDDDDSDTAGKFYEAIKKFVIWNQTKKLTTSAIAEFKSLYVNKHFPNLSVVKKLSIKHHLELVNDILNKVNK